MKQISIMNAVSKLALVGVTGLLVACGSSSSSTPADASISGIITAAPVNGADVSVVDGNGNIVVEAVKTDANGKYTLVIPNGSLGQDLIIKSTGGTFTDEATLLGGTAGEMYAYASANSLSNGSSVSATPGSTIVADLVMNHNKTMTQAQEAFANAFGYTPDISLHPADATTTPAAGETNESTLAGFRAAVFSQLAMDLGLSQDDQFEMFAALAKDLSDDVLNGVDASGAVAVGTTVVTLEANIQNLFEIALLNFHASGNNLTALNNAQIGNLPFARLALTTDHQIEYVQTGMMAAMEGKSTFLIRITDRISGDGVPGVVPMLMPIMYMADHKHSTPKLDCVPGVVDGDYDCTVYYLMASQMMDGASMGYWDLKFTVATEVAHFYPAVMMAMGDTPKVKLQAQTLGTDKIMTMNGEMNRKYFVFRDGLSGMGDDRTFTMFFASIENMMSYPAVFDGVTLIGIVDLIVNPLTTFVEVSTVEAPVAPADWIAAVDNGDGTWSAAAIPGLVDGTAGMIHVRLTVNGEVKTTDGKAPGATATIINEYSTFTITPGGM